MPKPQKLCLNVKNKHIKGVAPRGFVTDHKIFLKFLVIVVVLHEIQVHLPDTQLVGPVDQVDGLFLRMVNLNHKKEVS